jgi:HTH-type transcriptional regulator/antitoxin HipB
MLRKSSRSAERPSWPEALATEVRRRRKELRLTQRELAALARCGPDFLYDVENAKPTLRLDKLVDVLTAMGMRLTLESGSPGFVVQRAGTAP